MKSIMKTIAILFVAFGLVAVSGCQVVRGERSVSQYSHDSAITSKVKYRIMNHNDISAVDVHVQTDKGVVLLSGFVKNGKQKHLASRIAYSVKGVRAVKNKLVVQ